MKPLVKPAWQFLLALACLLRTSLPAAADQVQMLNGDRYNGKVLSLDAHSLILQNEVLGKLTLPRAKVGVVLLGPAPAAVSTNFQPPSAALTRSNNLAAHLSANTNLIQQVQRQFLTGADPVAQKKFNDLVAGLLGGTISVEDVQREARTAVDQARALKKELGPDAGFALDGYLAILDQFLKEAPATPDPPPAMPTNAPPRKD